MSTKKAGATGFRLAAFPKEFERNFWETFDRRYYSILLIVFIIFYSFAFYISLQEWQLSEDQIASMKQKVIQKIYDVKVLEPVAEEEPEVDFGTGGAEEEEAEEEPVEVSDRGQERLEESRTQAQQRRRNTRADADRRAQQMQQEVAGQGILAVATARGGAGSGNVAYSEVLGDMQGGGISDIGDIAGGGVAAATAPGQRSRAAKGSGQRADGGGTGIDDLINDGSVGGGGNFERRGNIELASDDVQLTAGQGSRDPDAITQAINRQARAVESCYQRRARTNPNLRGRIDLEIQIVADGSVSRVRTLQSSLGDSRLNECIERAIKRWKFGEVGGGDVRIRVPFIF